MPRFFSFTLECDYTSSFGAAAFSTRRWSMVFTTRCFTAPHRVTACLSRSTSTCSSTMPAGSTLHVTRNAAVMPDVFVPAENLVVSASVRDVLANIPNVQFQPVVFEKLFWLEFEKGDFGFRDRRRKGRHDTVACAEERGRYCSVMADVPARPPSRGLYYEGDHRPLANDAGYLSLQESEGALGPRLRRGVKSGRSTSSRPLYETSPSTAARRPWVCTDEVLAAIRDYIDWDYFDLASIEV